MKIKRLCTLLLSVTVIALCITLLPTVAQAATSGYYTYTVSDGEATITDCDTSVSGSITIPSTLGGYPVTCIGNSAFADCTALTGVVIPDSVTNIVGSAFQNCTNLKNVTIPDSVTAMGSSAFYGCTYLSSVSIPDSLTYISDRAFYGCKWLSEVDLGNSVTTIGKEAFAGCSNLFSVSIPATLTTIKSYAFINCGTDRVYITDLTAWMGIDFADYYSTPLRPDMMYAGNAIYLNGKLLQDLVIPEGTTQWSSYAFTGCLSLTSVTIPSSVESIGESAFYRCENLKSVTIADGVKKINNSVFSECKSLATIEIGSTVTSIGTSAFYFCSSLSDVYFGGTQAQWAKMTINSNNDPLTNAQIHCTGGVDAGSCGEGVTWHLDYDGTLTISGDGAMDECTNSAAYPWYNYRSSVKQIIIGSGVTSVGAHAFEGYSELTGIWVEEGNPSYSNDSYGVLFNADKTALLLAPMNLSGSYNIPDNVTNIGFAAFFGCGSLESVIVPAGLSGIGDSAFSNCVALETVFFEGTQEQWNAVAVGNSNQVLSAATVHYQVENAVFGGQECYYCPVCDSYFMTDGSYVQATVTFKDWDGTVLQTGKYAYKEQITAPEAPTKLPDNTYTYPFAGWDKALVCTGDMTVTATYTPTYIDYTVVFQNWDGALLCTNTYHYGDTVMAPADPDREADNTYTYTFAGWDKALICTGDMTVTATYTPVYINYSIVFQNWDGTVLSTGTYHYNDAITTPVEPAKAADNTYTYTFAGWDRELTCTGDMTITATYAPVYIDYTVVFQNWDGTVLATRKFHYGDAISVNITPSKAADNTYTYVFTGWDKETICMGDMTLTATYTPVYIDYTVTFRNWNGALLTTATYHYGDPIVIPQTPARPANMQYTYLFVGWNYAVGNCTGNAEYTARYKAIPIDYIVKFVNWDGTLLDGGTYHYGDAVSAPADPTRPVDDTYTYTFAGWDKELLCTGDMTITATYTPVYIDYTVVFQNWDGSVLSAETYHYGETVVAPQAPTRVADNTYSYAFSGWDKEVLRCSGDATYTAIYDAVYIDYTVTFKNEDGTELSSAVYHYGDAIVAPETPAKAADLSYTYSFAGWDKELLCTGDMTITATYTPVYINYSIVFQNWDGMVLSTGTYHYNDAITAPVEPAKAADNTYTYTFAGWDRELTCTGDMTITATYTPVYIDYTVVFQNWDGTVIFTETYHYGDAVEAPEIPEKAADNTYIYVFDRWDKELVCSGDMTVTATYTPVYIDYTVTFLNWDGVEISSQTYHYGDAVIPPADPTRPADVRYTYTFVGWDRAVEDCTGAAVYTAKYNPVDINYIVKFVNWDGTLLGSGAYRYGELAAVPDDPTHPADSTYTYTFTGWDQEPICMGDMVITATYEASYIDYTVIFQYADGTLVSQKTYHYGDVVEVPADPESRENGYQFDGWDKEVSGNCTGDAVYTAVFAPVYPVGDFTQDMQVTNEDVVYLLWYTLFPEDYPIIGEADFTGDGQITNEDVVYLLWYTLFPEDYPLVKYEADRGGPQR